MAKTVVLIDGTAYLFRCFYSVGERVSPAGVPVNAVMGLGRLILALLRRAEPSHAAVAFDAGPKTFRNELYPPYKSDRGAPPEELVPQFELAPKLCGALGLATATCPGFEADDVLATLAARAEKAGWRVTIVTGDKDLAQLVTDNVTIHEVVRDERIGMKDVERRFGVPPERMADLQALTGDSTDHFPGVRGVGPKTAVRLLAAAGTLDALLKDPDIALKANIRGAATIAQRLRDGPDEVRLWRKLARLRRDVPTGLRSTDLLWKGALRDQAEPLFHELGFPGMLRGVPRWQ